MSAKAKTPKYQHDGSYEYDGRKVYVRAWKEGRGRNGEIIVQVWNSDKAEGDPNGDWAMPGVLLVTEAIEQAILQTGK